jgi:hypothetical protein
MRFVITKLRALAYTESNAASAALNTKKFAGLSTRSISSALSATAKLAKRIFDSAQNEMGVSLSLPAAMISFAHQLSRTEKMTA